MGTCFHLAGDDEYAKVFIPRSKHKPALAALQKARVKHPPHYTPTPPLPKSKNLVEELTEHWLWEPTLDADYNIIGLVPVISGQKFDSEEVLFETLAPFVRSGEVLVESEEGGECRWKFGKGKVAFTETETESKAERE